MSNLTTMSRTTIDVGKRFTNGEDLLKAALTHITVDSVRYWAMHPHNYPILVQIAQGALDKNSNAYSDLRFATWMVCEAMGM
jgi:hypothetical protein